MMEKLPVTDFVRVHGSFIISLNKVTSLRNKIICIGEEEIPPGNSYDKSFLKLFKV